MAFGFFAACIWWPQNYTGFFDRSTFYTPLLGLTLGGVPAVLLAAFIVKSLPLTIVKWLVVVVVVYTAVTLFRSASLERRRP